MKAIAIGAGIGYVVGWYVAGATNTQDNAIGKLARSGWLAAGAGALGAIAAFAYARR